MQGWPRCSWTTCWCFPMKSEPTNKWASKQGHAPVKARGGHQGKGHGRPWLRLSRNLRANHPMCQVCQARPSAEVHHKVRWVDCVVSRLDPRNCVAVCRACHELLEKHGRKA